MKQLVLFLFLTLFLTNTLYSQPKLLTKGSVISGIKVNDSITESFSLFLPSNFDLKKEWPIVYVFDMEGKGRQALTIMVPAAEQEGYVLAASDNVHSSLSMEKNIAIIQRMEYAISNMFPFSLNMKYTAGFTKGANFSLLVPVHIKGIKGVISSSSSFPSYYTSIDKFRFYFVGIIDDEDGHYPQMLSKADYLNEKKFSNTLIIHKKKQDLPSSDVFADALRTLSLSAMVKGFIPKNDSIVHGAYNYHLDELNSLMASSKPLYAHHLLKEMIKIYGTHFNVDSLNTLKGMLESQEDYKAQSEIREGIFSLEKTIRENYRYYLKKDIETKNYYNLGWWNHEMEQIQKNEKSNTIFEQRMGIRLRKYLNSLIDKHLNRRIFYVKSRNYLSQKEKTYLWMLKTITFPEDYSNYLKIISNSAKEEDFGTALFYLEELFKRGYTNKEELKSLKNTALFRITPEYNELMKKYLKDSRYMAIQQ